MQVGVFCPTYDDLVLIVRRAFWNNEENKPRSFPGEWLLVSGERKGNESLEKTALREFREEMKFRGFYFEVKKFLIQRESYKGGKIHLHYFTSEVYDGEFEYNPEIIDHKLIKPCDAIDLILSPKFTKKQLMDFKKNGLDQHGINQRQIPYAAINALKVLDKKLNTGYKQRSLFSAPSLVKS